MDNVTALDQSLNRFSAAIGNVSADALSTPSACAGWDLRALLNHVLGAGWMFTRANQGETDAPEDAGDLVGDDHVKACAAMAEANLASWQGAAALEGERTFPFGTFPAEVALIINLGEIAIHTWDIQKATGQASAMDPEVAEVLLGFYGSMPLDGFRASGAFGAEVPVDASAPAGDRLLGLLGFQP
jgi:uncharacterized protein (TIGR03086 family)